MSIVELQITLEDVDPEVVRTLQVPLDIRLDRLHLVIQAAMGWQNCHLYEFMASGSRWALPDPVYDSEALDVAKFTLQEILESTSVNTLRYFYDFGDYWQHKINVGPVSEPASGALYPKLIKVAGRCPPEDVGGLPGYEQFLEALADPKHPNHEHLKGWYGGNFDPNAPETDELTFEVMKLAKKWKLKKP